MKKIILLIILLPMLAHASDATDRIKDLEYGLRSNAYSINYPDSWADFVPTKEMRDTVAAIKDPTERMLNHTFWRMTTIDEVKKLVSDGVKFDQENRYSRLRILDYALYSSNSAFVWAVLDAGPNTNYTSGGNGESFEEPYTPLMLAVIYFPNDIAMFKRIISLGCDPNAVTYLGTALEYVELYYLEHFELYYDEPPHNTFFETRQYLLSTLSPTLRLYSATFWETATPKDVLREIKNGADMTYTPLSENIIITSIWSAMKYAKNYESIQTLIYAGGKPLMATYKDSLVNNAYWGEGVNDPIFAIVIDATGLNIREEANANSAIVGKPLPKGSIVQITGAEQGGWVPINYKGRNAFVYKTLINPLAIVIDATGLNIREEANAHSAIVGKPLPEGSIVQITGAEHGDWVPISYQGRNGFVYKTLIHY